MTVLDKERQRAEGLSWIPRTPTYLSWSALMQRCMNPNSTSWKYYGGRGITVCERWRTFENFLADVGPRPPGMTIDRIDVNVSYEPGNVRWATRGQQTRNRRSVSKLSGLEAVLFRQMWIRARQLGAKTLLAHAFGISGSQARKIGNGSAQRDALDDVGLDAHVMGGR